MFCLFDCSSQEPELRAPGLSFRGAVVKGRVLQIPENRLPTRLKKTRRETTKSGQGIQTWVEGGRAAFAEYSESPPAPPGRKRSV